MNTRQGDFETRIGDSVGKIVVRNRHRICRYVECLTVTAHDQYLRRLHAVLSFDRELAIRGFKHYIDQAEERGTQNMGHLYRNLEHRMRRLSKVQRWPIRNKARQQCYARSISAFFWNDHQWLRMLGRSLADLDLASCAHTSAAMTGKGDDQFVRTASWLQERKKEVTHD